RVTDGTGLDTGRVECLCMDCPSGCLRKGQPVNPGPQTSSEKGVAGGNVCDETSKPADLPLGCGEVGDLVEGCLWRQEIEAMTEVVEVIGDVVHWKRGCAPQLFPVADATWAIQCPVQDR